MTNKNEMHKDSEANRIIDHGDRHDTGNEYMKNINQTYTDSEINRIIDRGVMLDWIGILSTIKANPEGELSQRVLAVCDANPGYAGSSIIKQAVIRYRTPETEVAPEIMKGTLDSKPNSWFN